jgi:hypothetical protein
MAFSLYPYSLVHPPFGWGYYVYGGYLILLYFYRYNEKEACPAAAINSCFRRVNILS